MKFWAGVTDGHWFRYLAASHFDEVNFWQPSGGVRYAELQGGELFLFKLRRPDNHIAGGGYFVRSTSLPASLAWEAFAQKNGAPDRQTFVAAIRRLSGADSEDPPVGCTVLAEPFFLPPDRWIEAPTGWAGNIVRGRYYDTNSEEGQSLWAAVQDRLVQVGVREESPARYGQPCLVAPRLGQGAFRVLVTDAYGRRCAITGESTLPVLDAAHILPYAEHGAHEVSNGLLLRSDFHKLFDLGLVTVTPDLTVEVSSRIRDEWFNGKAYYRLHGKRLAVVPERADWRPLPSLLQWHNEKRFRA
jgi:putative restriction endonuclease